MSNPATRLPGPTIVPGIRKALLFPFSILIGLTTAQLPFDNFLNEPHGAVVDTAAAAPEESKIRVRTVEIERFPVMKHSHAPDAVLKEAASRRKCVRLSLRQLLQQRLRLLQIARVKTLREPPVNRSKQFARLLRLALVAPEAGETGGSAKFEQE